MHACYIIYHNQCHFIYTTDTKYTHAQVSVPQHFAVYNNKDTDHEPSPAEISMGMYKQGRISSIGYPIEQEISPVGIAGAD